MSRATLACVLLLSMLSVQAAEFTAEVDRTRLYANEHLLLTLSLTDSETRLRAEGVSPNVDLTVLTGDFELGTPRADFRFNVNRARGRSTSSIAVELFPRRAGRLSIPSFTIEGMSTAPIGIEVLELPADATPEVFARSGIERARLHPREQTLLWLDLYHRVELKGARLGGPLETRPRAVEAHALPVAERDERVGAMTYRVTRTAWAVSAADAGTVTFMLPDIWVETRQGRQWRLPFSETQAEVVALPAGIPADALIGRPEIEQRITTAGAAGEALPWELELRSETALNALPASPPVEPSGTGLNLYADPAERRLDTLPDGRVQSVAIYRGHLMAGSAGDYVTPGIRVRYFDASTQREAVLSEPGLPLHVSPAAADAPLPSPLPVPDGAAATPSSPAWKWLALVFGLLWLSTLVLWAWRSGAWRRSAGVTTATSSAPGHPPAHHPLARLLAALEAPTLEQGLREREALHGADTGLREAIREVQRLCYGPGEGRDEEAIDRAVDRALAALRGRAAPRQSRTGAAEDPWSLFETKDARS